MIVFVMLLNSGCMSSLIERQRDNKARNPPSCPQAYSMTRLDMAGLDWAFSENQKPSDPCLADSFVKAGQDPFYQNSVRYLTPLIVLSLPIDLIIDTLTLPFAATRPEPASPKPTAQ